MSTPVVVQGTAVQSPYAGSGTQVQENYGSQANPSSSGDQTDPPKSGCKDPIFAVLFYGNVIAMVVVAVIYGPAAFEDAQYSESYTGYLIAVTLCAIISLLFSGLGLLVMMRFPETIIKASLIFVVVLSGAYAVLMFIAGSIIGGIFGVLFFAIGVCYARAVWSRIPFATINMVTGITAIQANFGVTIFAYTFAILAVGWSILWAISLAGVYELSCDVVNCSPNYGYLFLLLVSYFFTHQVLQVCSTMQAVERVFLYQLMWLAMSLTFFCLVGFRTLFMSRWPVPLVPGG